MSFDSRIFLLVALNGESPDLNLDGTNINDINFFFNFLFSYSFNFDIYKLYYYSADFLLKNISI